MTKSSNLLMGKLRLREVNDPLALVSEVSIILKWDPSFLALSHNICYQMLLPLKRAVSEIRW